MFYNHHKDNSTAVSMMDYIIEQSSSIFATQNPQFQFRGWLRGSVVCDYEMSFVTPLREIKANTEDNAKSAMNIFLDNVGTAFSDMGVDENYTTTATSQRKEISCDGNHFACDFFELLNDNVELSRTGACLPNRWLCDGYIQCPTLVDELGCETLRSPIKPETSFEPAVELFIDDMWISHQNYPKHYRNMQHTIQKFSTSSEMIFVLHFEMLSLEVDRVTGECADFVQVRYLLMNQTFTSKFCGNMETGQVPYVPPRRLIVPSDKFELTFQSDQFTHFDGYLIRVESIPKTMYLGFSPQFLNMTLFNDTLYFHCDPSEQGCPRHRIFWGVAHTGLFFVI